MITNSLGTPRKPATPPTLSQLWACKICPTTALGYIKLWFRGSGIWKGPVGYAIAIGIPIVRGIVSYTLHNPLCLLPSKKVPRRILKGVPFPPTVLYCWLQCTYIHATVSFLILLIFLGDHWTFSRPALLQCHSLNIRKSAKFRQFRKTDFEAPKLREVGRAMHAYVHITRCNLLKLEVRILI